MVAVVQLLSHVWLLVTSQTAACEAAQSFTISGSLLSSCSLSPWCHPTILSSVIPFSCLQSFPESGSFPMSWLFASGGQSIGASASDSVLPTNIQDSGLISFRIDWFDLLAVQRTLKSLLQHHSLKVWILWCSALFMVQLSYPYMTSRQTVVLTTGFCWQSKCLWFLIHCLDLP